MFKILRTLGMVGQRQAVYFYRAPVGQINHFRMASGNNAFGLFAADARQLRFDIKAVHCGRYGHMHLAPDQHFLGGGNNFFIGSAQNFHIQFRLSEQNPHCTRQQIAFFAIRIGDAYPHPIFIGAGIQPETGLGSFFA